MSAPTTQETDSRTTKSGTDTAAEVANYLQEMKAEKRKWNILLKDTFGTKRRSAPIHIYKSDYHKFLTAQDKQFLAERPDFSKIIETHDTIREDIITLTTLKMMLSNGNKNIVQASTTILNSIASEICES